MWLVNHSVICPPDWFAPLGWPKVEFLMSLSLFLLAIVTDFMVEVGLVSHCERPTQTLLRRCGADFSLPKPTGRLKSAPHLHCFSASQRDMKAPPKINHEETKSTKKDQKKYLRLLRFFVVDFHRFWASLTAT